MATIADWENAGGTAKIRTMSGDEIEVIGPASNGRGVRVRAVESGIEADLPRSTQVVFDLEEESGSPFEVASIAIQSRKPAMLQRVIDDLTDQQIRACLAQSPTIWADVALRAELRRRGADRASTEAQNGTVEAPSDPDPIETSPETAGGSSTASRAPVDHLGPVASALLRRIRILAKLSRLRGVAILGTAAVPPQARNTVTRKFSGSIATTLTDIDLWLRVLGRPPEDLWRPLSEVVGEDGWLVAELEQRGGAASLDQLERLGRGWRQAAGRLASLGATEQTPEGIRLAA